MNGFDEEIRHRVFGIAPQVTVTNYKNLVEDWQDLDAVVKEHPNVQSSSPYVNGLGLMNQNGMVNSAFISGILPEKETLVSEIESKMIAGSFKELQAKSFAVVLGKALADSMGIIVGDKLTIMVPKANVTPVGLTPRFKRFTVVGIFEVGSGFQFDNRLAFVHLRDAQILFQMGTAVSGLKLKVNDLYAAPIIANQLYNQLGAESVVADWTQQFGAFFKAIQLEKTMMFLILLLIIAVAIFNLVSSLVMIVTDKQADIAILRTMGATPRMILAVFMLQGSIIGIIGTVTGLVGGLLLASNVTEIVNWLQHTFNLQILSSSVYFVDYLPSKIEWNDIIKICSAALSMSFVATLYPAWRAAKTLPAEALRYE